MNSTRQTAPGKGATNRKRAAGGEPLNNILPQEKGKPK
nr:MAG TPA: hypothetical protein [Inoviridae sp.]